MDKIAGVNSEIINFWWIGCVSTTDLTVNFFEDSGTVIFFLSCLVTYRRSWPYFFIRESFENLDVSFLNVFNTTLVYSSINSIQIAGYSLVHCKFLDLNTQTPLAPVLPEVYIFEIVPWPVREFYTQYGFSLPFSFQ